MCISHTVKDTQGGKKKARRETKGQKERLRNKYKNGENGKEARKNNNLLKMKTFCQMLSYDTQTRVPSISNSMQPASFHPAYVLHCCNSDILYMLLVSVPSKQIAFYDFVISFSLLQNGNQQQMNGSTLLGRQFNEDV